MTLISEKARATIANLQARLAKATGRDNLIQAAAAASAKRAPLDVPSAKQMDELQELRDEELQLCQKLKIPAGSPPIFSGQSAADVKVQVANLHVTCAELTRMANNGATAGYKSKSGGTIFNPRQIAAEKAKVAAAAKAVPPVQVAKVPATRPTIQAPMPSAAAIASAMLDEQERRATSPMSRADFSKLTPAAKMAFVKAGRQITA